MRYYLRDFFKVVFYVLVLYIPVAWYSTEKAIDSLYEHQINQSTVTLRELDERIGKSLQHGDSSLACLQLKASADTHNIAAYFLDSSEASCSYPEGLVAMPPMAVGEIKTFSVKGVLLTFIKGSNQGTSWIVGLASPVRKSFGTYLLSESAILKAFLSEISYVIYVACLLVFFVVLIFAKGLKERLRAKGKNPWWLRLIESTFGRMKLHDLKIVETATLSLSRKAEDLQRDKDLLETSLEFSILNEIKANNAHVPYAFPGTVAKVDINGFSKVVNSSHEDASYYLTESLELFGCELLQRYGGLFEKTVGDEIVVVFRHGDHRKFAAAFIRDLMREFSSLEFQIGVELRSFTLKGSFSSSQINFRKRPSGYGFDGEALTKASRLLDTVTEKSNNVVSCLAVDEPSVDSLIRKKIGPQTLAFKNMSSAEVYWLTEFIEVESALADQDLLPYFRSDYDIIYLLSQVCSAQSTQVLATLKEVTVRKCSDEVVASWCQALTLALNSLSASEISKLIMLALNLVPSEKWTSKCSDLLLSIPLTRDDRINSSIIAVFVKHDIRALAHLDSVENIKFENTFRAKGDLLLGKAILNLNEKTLQELSTMLHSNIELERNTAIYCCCALLLHYRKEGGARLESYSGYYQILKKLKDIYKQNFKDLSARLKTLLVEAVQEFESES